VHTNLLQVHEATVLISSASISLSSEATSAATSTEYGTVLEKQFISANAAFKYNNVRRPARA
jgi:hypothetical protein